MQDKCPCLWHQHPPKFSMHHQCKLSNPPPQLHLLHWDRCLHNKTVPTIHPQIINKGKLGMTDPETKATINYREVVNNQTLKTMSQQTGQPKIIHEQKCTKTQCPIVYKPTMCTL